jgi:hypothetical protein
VVGKDNVWRERGGRDFYGKIDVIVRCAIQGILYTALVPLRLVPTHLRRSILSMSPLEIHDRHLTVIPANKSILQEIESQKGEDETGWVKVVGKDNVWRERGGRDFYGKN